MQLFGIEYWEIVLRLFVSVICGGIIGFERAGRNRDAGIRTHMLVCLGSSSVMLLSQLICNQYGINDIFRMSAQVISGIGFLGVGCIISGKNNVRGLTTAAGIWTTACIGLIVGIGYYAVAGIAAAIMIFMSIAVSPLVRKIQKKFSDNIVYIKTTENASIEKLLIALKNLGVKTSSIKIDFNHDNTKKLTFQLFIKEKRGKGHFEREKILGKISEMEDIIQISIT